MLDLSYLSPKTVVKASPIHGRGLNCRKTITGQDWRKKKFAGKLCRLYVVVFEGKDKTASLVVTLVVAPSGDKFVQYKHPAPEEATTNIQP